jgi:hypothetical protein
VSVILPKSTGWHTKAGKRPGEKVILKTDLNHALDTFVHPYIHTHGHDWSAFKMCGYTGLGMAVLLAMSLTLKRGLSPWVMGIIICSAILTFYGLAYATKIIKGAESLTYYHHEIGVIFIAACLLWLLHQPVLAYLDATLLGVGLFLVFGRVGCLMVGCCHGRPSSFGVCYREEHAAAGFTPYYLGIRLFPIQAVEALWVFLIVITGSRLVWQGQPPGTAFVWYVIIYDIGRFAFEFVRGDPGRPYYKGFSEAQWISVGLTWAVALAELTHILPLRLWHIGVAVGLLTVVICIFLWRRLEGNTGNLFLYPSHMKEIAEIVESLSASPLLPDISISVARTSFGIQISSGIVTRKADQICHFSISGQNDRISEDSARMIASSILLFKRYRGKSELVRGNNGVYHLLLDSLSS